MGHARRKRDLKSAEIESRRPPPTPSNRTAFCASGSDEACRDELQGSSEANKCSADYEHVAQHMLPPRTIHVDALYVDARGNGHTDISVVGVIYRDDQDGRPGEILGTSSPVLVEVRPQRRVLVFAARTLSAAGSFQGAGYDRGCART